jgi:hypothetical protein
VNVVLAPLLLAVTLSQSVANASPRCDFEVMKDAPIIESDGHVFPSLRLRHVDRADWNVRDADQAIAIATASVMSALRRGGYDEAISSYWAKPGPDGWTVGVNLSDGYSPVRVYVAGGTGCLMGSDTKVRLDIEEKPR